MLLLKPLEVITGRKEITLVMRASVLPRFEEYHISGFAFTVDVSCC
jgi:hypothetical protein